MGGRAQLLRCSIAAGVAASTILTTRVTPFDEPLLVFVLPCLAMAYWGGLAPGLTATLIVAAAAMLETDPRGELRIAEGKALAEVNVLIGVGVFASTLCHLLRMSRAAALLENERFRAVSASNRTLEERLRQDEKMKSLGLLAGGVAHDFNNLLAVVKGNAEMLAESLTSEDPDRELVVEIDQAVQRGQDLTRQLLAFSRKQASHPVVLELSEASSECAKLVTRIVGEHIRVVTTIATVPCYVRMNRGALMQLIMNLSVNARDAMPTGGTLSISTTCLDGSMELTVGDTGTGASPEAIKRMFEPFFTTKKAGAGTGMGLAVVHAIVEQAGGQIEIESELGAGTQFRVTLPSVPAPSESESTDKKSPVQPGVRGEPVLLVDDDPHVRKIVARGLRQRGYSVTEAASGDDALKALSATASLTTVISDVVMPGLHGAEFREAALSQQGSLRFLFISGFPDDELVRHGVMRGSFELLTKPFSIDELVERLESMRTSFAGTFALDGKAKVPENG